MSGGQQWFDCLADEKEEAGMTEDEIRERRVRLAARAIEIFGLASVELFHSDEFMRDKPNEYLVNVFFLSWLGHMIKKYDE